MSMLQQYFDQLDVRLGTCRMMEKRLGKEVAHRFNVLDYLDTRENGLSRIIGDLLDPKGCHGQGSFFLKILLEKLNIDPGEPGLDLDGATVALEYSIEDGRRIDVYV